MTEIKKTTLTKIKKLIDSKYDCFLEGNQFGLEVQMLFCTPDETKLNFNVKSHRGRNFSACYCFVLCDTSYSSSLGFYCIAPDRTRATLLGIIYEVAISGSIIHTNESPAYRQIGIGGSFEHLTVCHKYNFVDPGTGTHKQNVKSYNNCLKYFIKAQKGMCLLQKKSFLKEFMFRERHTNNIVFAFIDLLNNY